MASVYLRIGALVLVLASCVNSVLRPSGRPPVTPIVHRPVPPLPTVADVQRRGKITFLMDHGAASHFLYRGSEMGFEYELAREFAKELGVKLEVRTPPPNRALTTWLAEGRGEVAAGLVTTDRFEPGSLRLSIPYLETTVEILTNSDEPAFRDMTDLARKKVVVQRGLDLDHVLPPPQGTSALSVFTEEAGREVVGTALPAAVAVTEKRAAAAVMITPLAKLMQTFYPDKLQTAVTLAEPVRLVWAVQPEQTDLLHAINAFLKRASRSGLKKILFEKYFISTDRWRNINREPGFTLTSQRLSRFDSLIATYAEEAGFDWRLVGALIFEESRFNPKRVSQRGAYGLMQITRIAARAVGMKRYTTPRENIETGVRYLQALAHQFPYGRREDRLALVLASYLLGPGRVEDAQRLARVQGYDPHCWRESMDQILPLLEDPVYYRQTRFGFAPGRTAVRYVNAILTRYALYTRYVSRELAPVMAAQSTEPVETTSAAG